MCIRDSYWRAILAPQEHRKPQKSRIKVHLLTGYTLSTRDQRTPLISLIYSQIHVTIFPPMAKLLYSHINIQHPLIPILASAITRDEIIDGANLCAVL